MERSLNYQLYENMLLTLKRNCKNGITSVAKPIYVLSIFEAIETNIVFDNKLYPKDLMPIYTKMCKKKRIEKIPFFYYPYCYLQSDGFYNLHWKGPQLKIISPSAKFIREHIDFAYLDNTLWDLLQDVEVRQEYKELIENHYLT